MTIETVIDGLYGEIAASNPGQGGPAHGSLRIQLHRVIRDLTRYTEASIKLAVLESTDLLIDGTPKDTKWASSSWFPSYGQGVDNGGYLVDPDEFEFEGQSIEDLVDLNIGSKLKERQVNQVRAIVSFANTRIFVNQHVARSPELSNGVPYIEELDKGKSDQASAGFVERSINAGLVKLETRASGIAFAGGRTVRFI